MARVPLEEKPSECLSPEWSHALRCFEPSREFWVVVDSYRIFVDAKDKVKILKYKVREALSVEDEVVDFFLLLGDRLVSDEKRLQEAGIFHGSRLGYEIFRGNRVTFPDVFRRRQGATRVTLQVLGGALHEKSCFSFDVKPTDTVLALKLVFAGDHHLDHRDIVVLRTKAHQDKGWAKMDTLQDTDLVVTETTIEDRKILYVKISTEVVLDQQKEDNKSQATKVRRRSTDGPKPKPRHHRTDHRRPATSSSPNKTSS